MMQSSKREMQRGYTSLQIDPPSAIDVSSSDSSIPPRRAKELTNVTFKNKSITSNGLLNTVTTTTQSTDQTPFSETFTYGTSVFGIYKPIRDDIIVMDTATGSTYTVKNPDGSAFDATSYTRAEKYGDTFILFGENAIATPKVLYYDSATLLWKVRNLGIIAPTIKAVTVTTPTTPVTKRFRYGVDLIVVENGIVVRSSGVSRRMADGTMFGIVDLSASNTATIEIDPPSAPANTWTHVRLWRCKNLLEVDGQIQGVESALYTIFAKTQAEIISAGYKFPASILDDFRLPYGGQYFDQGVTTPEVLDLSPLSGFSVYGSSSTRRLIATGLPSDISGIYFSAASYASRYAEQYSPADRLSSAEELGIPLKVGAISDDIIVVGSRGIFRIPNSDLDSTMVPVGKVGAIPGHESVRVISDFGIVCCLSDGSLRFMDRNFSWSSTYGKGGDGLPLEWPSRNLVVLWSRNTLSIAEMGGQGYYHLGFEEGWTYRKTNPILGLWDAGKGGISNLIFGPSPDYTISLHTPFVSGASTLTSAITLGPFQPVNLGDGLIEFLEFRVEGKFTDSEISFEANGIPLIAIDGVDAQLETRTHTYRVVDQTPNSSRVVDQRIFVRITSSAGASFVFDGFTMRAILQQGASSPSRYSSSLEQTNMAQQQAFLSGLVQRFTRPNALSDFYGSGDIS